MKIINKNHFYLIITSVVLSILVFYVNIVLLNSYMKDHPMSASYISNQYAFSYEIGGNSWEGDPEKFIEDWMWNRGAPYKYRILGNIPVWITYKLITTINNTHPLNSFYYSYVSWSFIFLVASGILFGFFCLLLFSKLFQEQSKMIQCSIACSVLFYCFPPILFAFKFPVHGSPNDFLSYALISLSLILFINNKLHTMIAVCVVSIFCRETTLICLLPILFYTKISIKKRVLLVAIPLVLLICYRVLWPGSYNPLIAARHNYKFIDESIGFIILTFSGAWILGVRGWISLKNETKNDEYIAGLLNSFWLATVVTILVTLILARIREIRLEYILYYYFIPLSVYFVIRNKKEILSIASSWIYLLYTLICLILLYRSYELLDTSNYVVAQYFRSIFSHLYAGRGGGWIDILFPHLFLTLATLPFIIVIPTKQTIDSSVNEDIKANNVKNKLCKSRKKRR